MDVYLCTHHRKNLETCWLGPQGTGSEDAKASESARDALICFVSGLQAYACMGHLHPAKVRVSLACNKL